MSLSAEGPHTILQYIGLHAISDDVDIAQLLWPHLLVFCHGIGLFNIEDWRTRLFVTVESDPQMWNEVLLQIEPSGTPHTPHTSVYLGGALGFGVFEALGPITPRSGAAKRRSLADDLELWAFDAPPMDPPPRAQAPPPALAAFDAPAPPAADAGTVSGRSSAEGDAGAWAGPSRSSEDAATASSGADLWGTPIGSGLSEPEPPPPVPQGPPSPPGAEPPGAAAMPGAPRGPAAPDAAPPVNPLKAPGPCGPFSAAPEAPAPPPDGAAGASGGPPLARGSADGRGPPAGDAGASEADLQTARSTQSRRTAQGRPVTRWHAFLGTSLKVTQYLVNEVRLPRAQTAA